MPGCVLRVSGSGFDVDAFLKKSTLRPGVQYRLGQRRKPASRGSHKASGFNVVVSEHDESLDKQVGDAIAFLRDNRDELMRMGRFGGVEAIVLDFACPQSEIATRSARFPSDLLVAAGGLGIDLYVSFYLVG